MPSVKPARLPLMHLPERLRPEALHPMTGAVPPPPPTNLGRNRPPLPSLRSPVPRCCDVGCCRPPIKSALDFPLPAEDLSSDLFRGLQRPSHCRLATVPVTVFRAPAAHSLLVFCAPVVLFPQLTFVPLTQQCMLRPESCPRYSRFDAQANVLILRVVLCVLDCLVDCGCIPPRITPFLLSAPCAASPSSL